MQHRFLVVVIYAALCGYDYNSKGKNYLSPQSSFHSVISECEGMGKVLKKEFYKVLYEFK